MVRKILLLVTILVGMVFLISCKARQSTPIPEANMPNPASVYCEDQGYKLEIVTAEDGSQSGLCIFPEGSSCDEWAYYRGECSPGQRSADQLVIETHQLTGSPDPETLQFTSVDGRQFTAADFEISTPFPSNQMEGTPLRFTVTLNGDTLISSDGSQPCEFEGCINVTRNGEEIFRTDVGGISPIEPLRGLWTYDNHWVLETNLFLEDTPYHGQIFVDGKDLNAQNGYEESFNFQTINGRPFYFFRRDGKMNAWFDGQEIPLGYDDVPHYLCCSDSGLNPKARQGAVLFFGSKDGQWYFVRMAAPGVLASANLPNPASAYCEQQGFRVEIRISEDGSQTGYCIYSDGSECDEWAYYRGECGAAFTMDETSTMQPPSISGTEISYGPVSLVLPPEIATGASGTEIPPFDSEESAWFQKTPGHTQINLADYYVLQDKFHQPQIYVYPAQAYAEMVPPAFESIRRLDITLYGSDRTISVDQLPTVPFFNAAQVFAANIQVIDFQNGGGVRFLTEYAQYAAPANNYELFYHFQGVTRDGAYYIIAILPVTAPLLAETFDREAAIPQGGVIYPDVNDPNADWDGYYNAITDLLNATSPQAFTPTLDQLDALIQSIQIMP